MKELITSRKILIIIVILVIITIGFVIWQKSGLFSNILGTKSEISTLSEEQIRERLHVDDEVISFNDEGFSKDSIRLNRFTGINVKNDTSDSINITLNKNSRRIYSSEIGSLKEKVIPKFLIFEGEYVLSEANSGARVIINVEK